MKPRKKQLPSPRVRRNVPYFASNRSIFATKFWFPLMYSAAGHGTIVESPYLALLTGGGRAAHRDIVYALLSLSPGCWLRRRMHQPVRSTMAARSPQANQRGADHDTCPVAAWACHTVLATSPEQVVNGIQTLMGSIDPTAMPPAWPWNRLGYA